MGGKVHRESAARRRFGKIAEVKRGASEARRRGEEREQNAERGMQNAAFLAGWHDPTPKTASARLARSRHDISQRQAGCSCVVGVLLSYSLRILLVFSWYSLRILVPHLAWHPATAAASLPRAGRVMVPSFDRKPRRPFISLFSVAGFGLVSLHDVDRADDPIG